MRIAIIRDDIVENIIVADNAASPEQFGGVPADGLAIGDRYSAYLLADQVEARIAQSKADLAAYLEAHPFVWTDGNTYTCTTEKQQQLTSKLLAATMAKMSMQPYTLTWNTSGGVCQEWTLDTLSALAFAIDAYVTPLVTYQQTMEVAMREAKTQAELDAIVVDYDTVGAAAQEALL